MARRGACACERRGVHLPDLHKSGRSCRERVPTRGNRLGHCGGLADRSVLVQTPLSRAVFRRHISDADLPGAPAARHPSGQLQSSEFAHHPVGDGRFRLGSVTPGSTVEFLADTGNYRGRARLDRLVLAITPSPGAALTKVLSGDADFFEAVPPANVSDIEHDSALVALLHNDPSYGFLWFNLRAGSSPHPHPIFGDRAVRQALAMAMDRKAIIRNVCDTLAYVANGPFARGTSSADPQALALPYDTARADRCSIRPAGAAAPMASGQKAGRPLAFSVSVPTSSKVRQQIAVLVQDQLSRIGARVTVDPSEMNAWVTQLRHHDFDAAVMVWHTDGAMDDLRQSWATSAVRDGVNFGSYESPAFDALVDSALAATNPVQTHALLHRAYAQINEDVPAVWLYHPREIIAVHRRVHTGVLRADAWYTHLADWYIPPESRLPRDNIGLAATPR